MEKLATVDRDNQQPAVDSIQPAHNNQNPQHQPTATVDTDNQQIAVDNLQSAHNNQNPQLQQTPTVDNKHSTLDTRKQQTTAYDRYTRQWKPTSKNPTADNITQPTIQLVSILHSQNNIHKHCIKKNKFKTDWLIWEYELNKKIQAELR